MNYGIDIGQLRSEIVAPTLSYIGLYSVAAEQLVLGTALQESHSAFLKQVGKGPALGLWQMEPATHDDIWKNFIANSPSLMAKVSSLLTDAYITEGSRELIGNLYYGCAMCRLHYRRVREPLPQAGDVLQLTAYWKNYYNTVLGAGNESTARVHFEAACRE